jgi:hypothetical protein
MFEEKQLKEITQVLLKCEFQIQNVPKHEKNEKVNDILANASFIEQSYGEMHLSACFLDEIDQGEDIWGARSEKLAVELYLQNTQTREQLVEFYSEYLLELPSEAKSRYYDQEALLMNRLWKISCYLMLKKLDDKTLDQILTLQNDYMTRNEIKIFSNAD